MGIEPPTFCVESREGNHYTTSPPPPPPSIVVIRLFALPSKKKTSGIGTAQNSCCVTFCSNETTDTISQRRKSCSFDLCCPSFLYERVPIVPSGSSEGQKKDNGSSNVESTKGIEMRLATARSTTSEGESARVDPTNFEQVSGTDETLSDTTSLVKQETSHC